MIKVAPLTDLEIRQFTRLFADYYGELDCDEDIPHLLEEYILPDLLAGLIKIEILKDGETFAGFVIYQQDDIDNEWNFKEGWGDVREIYIIPSLRRKGYGRFMLYAAEMKLKEAGADKAYCLPCAEAEKFFESCGYSRGNGYSEELECFVYEKNDLNNRCK